MTGYWFPIQAAFQAGQQSQAGNLLVDAANNRVSSFSYDPDTGDPYFFVNSYADPN
jgi:hypothetical protein